MYQLESYSMLFNSYEFIFLFLPVTFFVYYYLIGMRFIEASKVFLITSSLFFYSWWNIYYLPIILISLLFNYTIGKSLSQYSRQKNVCSKKSILLFGIVCNLLLLGYFKYINFFIDNINFFVDTNIRYINILLPLAISFFTFQQIAYLVDSYRKETHEYDFLNYALFVTFFPQLIAGPIVHHKEMMPQFSNLRNKIKNYRNVLIGLFIFVIGLFKKVVIADTFSVWASNGFDNAISLSFLEAWATSLSYSFQLYFDFSGYCDMAIGIALLFNIKLPINFNSPYKALNIQDFWRRWHITLSKFLKDYIYIPLGGSKQGSFKTYSNLLITFLIGGLWHGAGWTFIFWGFLHGVALIIHRVWQSVGLKLPTIVAWFITFNFVNIAWIFFRAKEWSDAIKVLSSMFSLQNIVLPERVKQYLEYLFDVSLYSLEFSSRVINLGEYSKSAYVYIFVAFFIILYFNNSIEKLKVIKFNLYTMFYMLILFMISLGELNEFSEFLYFNF